MPCASRAWPTAQRRRSGLRSFPRRCPSTPASPGSAPRPDASASHSPAPVPSAAAPDPPSTHQTPCANGNTSARRSQLPCRLAVTSSRSQHSLQPVAADSRSAPPYASCLAPYSTPLVPVCLISTGTNRAGHSNDRLTVQLQAETFNVLNHPNFGYIDPSLSDALFGQSTKMLNQSFGATGSLYQQGGPRSVQFSLKFLF